MAQPLHLQVTADNSQYMGCSSPDADVEMYEEHELIGPRGLAPCIGSDCSSWNAFEPNTCKFMDTSYLTKLGRQVMRNVFLSTVINK